ncbi:hypothetical protein I307_05313 [Cryptococcus deuterogattii 99/473]|uniref:Fe2OG dioxygenase domain-containing protein n=1 Tax=Cryptococcus deuterogattii Ram5 TaxID=1296110 RepID=A0A0D0TYE6_9TREE|nr:hypothetical protein I313_02869 [Cryptococcus deuterogattii Ram5]KIR72279.1 hypothetical protein I310_03681 [Cryptococcus deuterogattii CA1014]KIY55296.1 hypothetical protein I307_05313 [Cryptococcus deuterogattii 99/473]
MSVPCISLHNFDERRDEIIKELMDASMNVGFFTLCNHGISPEDVQAAFELSREFFALPDEIKSKTPLNGKNAGWEKNTQVRPSTGTADQKESMQLQFARMEGLWPSDEDVSGFRAKAEKLMNQVQALSVNVMECFADGLGLPHDIFTDGTVECGENDCQNVLRLLHYHSTEGKHFGPNFWRAGAHADFDILTMLFQRDGEGGLEVCPGRKVVSDFGMGQTWIPVEALQDRIVCNIGDQLMRWSDDRLKSTYHRVRLPEGNEKQGPRYSIAFFNQSRTNTVIQGPQKKYPPITGGEFIAEAMAKNRMQSVEIARQAALENAEKVATEVHFVPKHLPAAA